MLTGRFIHAHRALSTNLVSEVVADNQLEAAAQRYVALSRVAIAHGCAPEGDRLQL